jgi:hypothetical protein
VGGWSLILLGSFDLKGLAGPVSAKENKGAEHVIICLSRVIVSILRCSWQAVEVGSGACSYLICLAVMKPFGNGDGDSYNLLSGGCSTQGFVQANIVCCLQAAAVMRLLIVHT